MSIQKFRSVEEMPSLVTEPVENPVERMRALWRRVRRLAPPLAIQRGVQRFRNIEEANEARLEETNQRLRAASR